MGKQLFKRLNGDKTLVGAKRLYVESKNIFIDFEFKLWNFYDRRDLFPKTMCGEMANDDLQLD